VLTDEEILRIIEVVAGEHDRTEAPAGSDLQVRVRRAPG
jgi:hypothetical protein